ncbi:hypothetical protein BS17DRAFT_877408 [Gyrodon lividus]|nr:hypothetical protein BS17DRAFT_877408 [Gyrodon lividus]
MFCFLPAELIETIFDQFDVPSLLRCMQVCKLFQAIISESTHLLYKIDLFGSRMGDGRHSALDIVDRLTRLRSYNQVWNEMRWTGSKKVPMEGGSSWDLVGGVLAHALFNDRSISCVQLPCSIKGIPEKRWIVDLEITIRDFYFDVAQDLLICIEVIDDELCRIHFLTLSTGKRHPLACTPTVTHEAPDLPMWIDPRFFMQICGPRIIILLEDVAYGAPSVGDFVAWDWRTGELEMFIRCAELCSFSMLTEDLILVATIPMPCEPSLDVVSISECRRVLKASPNGSPLQFADIPSIRGFQLPKVRGGADIEIVIRSEPSPLASPSPSLRVPFSISQGDCLYVVTMRITAEEDGFLRDHLVTLLTLRSTFLAHVNQQLGANEGAERHTGTISSRLNENVHAHPSPACIPWHTWGPDGTHILPLKPSDAWVCYTHDTKFIHRTSENTAYLYEFNPCAVRRHHAQESEATHDNRLWRPLDLESKIEGNVFPFLEKVTTRLPGSIALVELPHTEGCFLGPMLAEDNIVVATMGQNLSDDSFAYLYM